MELLTESINLLGSFDSQIMGNQLFDPQALDPVFVIPIIIIVY
ncbi:hypothetical protein [Pseudoalteromonas piscicida]|nr:hypothetical protein [Pseudoalteromonas piscicida]